MIDYRLVRSNRKSLAIEVTRELEVVVRAPFFVSQRQIDAFLDSHQGWIEKAKGRIKERAENKVELSDRQIKELKNAAKEYIPKKVLEFSEIMDLKPSDVKITSARTRFGSCSPKNSLCFSYRLMLYPKEAVDYVIVHELAHIKHKNHGKRFYALIEKYLPDYRERNKLLKSDILQKK
ncbi:MAG: M48 family metallopeptidase [Ruminococcaceae bacterium]|nr:M48 family metallopeptidase [Oscillospiraceae bacterium]